MKVAARSPSLLSREGLRIQGGGPWRRGGAVSGWRRAREVRAGFLGCSGGEEQADCGRGAARSSFLRSRSEGQAPLSALFLCWLVRFGASGRWIRCRRGAPQTGGVGRARGKPLFGLLQHGGGGAFWRRSTPWSRRCGLPSTPRPMFPGESSNPCWMAGGGARCVVPFLEAPPREDWRFGVACSSW